MPRNRSTRGMTPHRRTFVFGTAVAAIMSLALGALAAPSPDTLLVAGYDSDEMRLYYDTLTVEVEEGGDLTVVCTDGPEEADDEVQLEDDDLVLDPENQQCALEDIDVSRDGTVTHGSVVSAFVAALGDLAHGKGCLVRFIARSDWGKQVDDDDFTLQGFPTDCVHGPDELDELEADEVEDESSVPGWARRLLTQDESGDWQPGGGPPPWAGKGKANGNGKPEGAGAAGKGKGPRS